MSKTRSRSGGKASEIHQVAVATGLHGNARFGVAERSAACTVAEPPKNANGNAACASGGRVPTVQAGPGWRFEHGNDVAVVIQTPAPAWAARGTDFRRALPSSMRLFADGLSCINFLPDQCGYYTIRKRLSGAVRPPQSAEYLRQPIWLGRSFPPRTIRPPSQCLGNPLDGPIIHSSYTTIRDLPC